MSFEGYARLESMRVIVDEMLLTMTDAEEKRNAYLHLYGVSAFALMLAQKRGLNPEIAAVAGLLHDYYAYKTGIRQFHDVNGAETVRPIIRDMGIFTKEEQKTILCAIFHHSDKGNIHDVYDEIIKDADVLQHYFYYAGKRVPINEAARLKPTLQELSLPSVFEIEENKICNSPDASNDKRKMLADIAEALASKGIIGIPADPNYRDICRYWPDGNIYAALKESWCAAFVYYCCRQAGFLLPIRYPNGICRFAGVAAWLEWAKLPEVQFFHSVEETGFTPQRGDVVIYEKLLSDESHDHIGIVLSFEKNGLLVAEGNMDNKNQSSIVHRDKWEKILGYIRICNDYQYHFSGVYNPRLDL